MSDGGKGSRPRPFSVDQKTFDANWDAIFSKKTSIEEEINEISKLVADETLQATEPKAQDNK